MTQDKITALQQQLDDLQKEYQEYAYIISHDFGAPLRHIREFTQILINRIEHDITDDEKKYVDIILNAVEKSENMLESLLEFSRLNTLAQPFEPVDCNEILQQVISILQHRIQNTGAYITINDRLPQVNGDRTQLKKLFYHVLDNAIKFKRNDITPTITIRANTMGGMWRFSIEDNGIGINPDYEERLFTMFKQVDPYHTSGMGIGLPICRKIVHHHDGEIHYGKNQSNGTTFYFTLPQLPR